MSIRCINWVFEHSETRLGERLTLLALADYAHDDGSNAWPAYPELGRKAKLSKRQAIRCCQQLEAGGHIVREGITEYGTIRWRVIMDVDEIERHRIEAERDPLTGFTEALNRGGDKTSPPGVVPIAGAGDKTSPPTQPSDKTSPPTPTGAVTNTTGAGDIPAQPATEMSPNPSLEPSVEPTTPQPPAQRGAQPTGGSPRQKGTNPRALGKHGPPLDLKAPTPADRQAWANAQQLLVDQVGESTFDIWLKDVQVIGTDQDTLVLQAPNATNSWVEHRFARVIATALDRPWRPATPADRTDTPT